MTKHRKPETPQEKIEKLAEEAGVNVGDLNAFDGWDQEDPEQRRDLTPEEQEKLRTQARQRIQEHHKRKLSYKAPK